MTLNENMKGFNSRNPFVIRCSNVIYDIDEQLLGTTKNAVRNTLAIGIMAIFTIIGIIMSIQNILSRHEVVLISIITLSLDTLIFSLVILHVVIMILYFKRGIKNSTRSMAVELLNSVKDEVLLVNNEKVLNATDLLRSFSGLIDMYEDLFDIEWRFAITGWVVSMISIITMSIF